MTLVNMTVANGIATVTLNRPDQRNAISPEVAEALRVAFDKAESDDSVRAVILAGAGKVFCAGMDLAAFAAGHRIGLGEPDGFANFAAWPRRKAVIAAVQGAALAGGMEIMLACDIVVAAEGSVFGLPETKRGLMPAGGGIFRLCRSVPPSVANEMLLTGEPIDARRAYELGLVSAIVHPDDLMSKAQEIAARIAANAPMAVDLTLSLSHAAKHAGEAELWALNNRYWKLIDASEDSREGALAFKEKRAPRWRNR